MKYDLFKNTLTQQLSVMIAPEMTPMEDNEITVFKL